MLVIPSMTRSHDLGFGRRGSVVDKTRRTGRARMLVLSWLLTNCNSLGIREWREWLWIFCHNFSVFLLNCQKLAKKKETVAVHHLMDRLSEVSLWHH